MRLPWYDDQPLDLGSGNIIRRGDLKKLLTEDLWDAVRLWQDYKRFGLFHGRGPEAETAEYVDLISALEEEYDGALAQARKMNEA